MTFHEPATVESDRAAPRPAARLTLSILLFVCLYLATVALTSFAGHRFLTYRTAQWVALAGALVSTFGARRLADRDRWRIGFPLSSRTVLWRVAAGAALAVLLLGAADALVELTTSMRHHVGRGLPYGEIFAIYLPAAFHEELVFRGYLFQKLASWRPLAAIAITSLLFGFAHVGNSGVSLTGVTNIVLAGALLAVLALAANELWLPSAFHLSWNLLSGPLLGYQVSGFSSERTLLLTTGRGNPEFTGGSFGIEGSIWTSVVLVVTLLLLSLWLRPKWSAVVSRFHDGRDTLKLTADRPQSNQTEQT
jgi:membrane protease YdiL (CAAX protease family)